MTYARLESRPNFYEFENGTREEEENVVDLNQSELSTRVLCRLNYIFSELFDYLRVYQYNEDYEMENGAFGLLAQLKRAHWHRDQLNEDVLDVFDELIERMRRDLSGNLGYMYQTGVYDIPVEHFKELLKEYRDKYLLLGINLE